MDFIVTDAGISAITDVRTNELKLKITKFALGSSDASVFTPSKSDVDVGGTKVHTGEVTNFFPEGNSTLAYRILLRPNVGPFLYGNIGLYSTDEDGNDTLFAIGVKDQQQAKTNPTRGGGNVIEELIRIKFADITADIDFTLSDSTEIPSLASLDLLDSYIGSVPVVVMEGTDSNDNNPILYTRKDGTWSVSTHPYRVVEGKITSKESNTHVESYHIPAINYLNHQYPATYESEFRRYPLDQFTQNWSTANLSQGAIHFDEGCVIFDNANGDLLVPLKPAYPLTGGDWTDLPDGTPFLIEVQFASYTAGTLAFDALGSQNTFADIEHNFIYMREYKSKSYDFDTSTSAANPALKISVTDGDFSIQRIRVLRMGININNPTNNITFSTPNDWQLDNGWTQNTLDISISGETQARSASIGNTFMADNSLDGVGQYYFLLTITATVTSGSYYVSAFNDGTFISRSFNVTKSHTKSVLIKATGEANKFVITANPNSNITINHLFINLVGVDIEEPVVSPYDDYYLQIKDGDLLGTLRKVTGIDYCNVTFDEITGTIASGTAFEILQSDVTHNARSIQKIPYTQAIENNITNFTLNILPTETDLPPATSGCHSVYVIQNYSNSNRSAIALKSGSTWGFFFQQTSVLTDLVYVTNGTRFWTLDVTNNGFTRIGDTTINTTRGIGGLSDIRGTLFYAHAPSEGLYRVSKTSGIATQAAVMSQPTFGTFVVDSVFYGSSGYELFTVNIVTGATSRVGELGILTIPSISILDLRGDFAVNGSTVYLCFSHTHSLYTVDIATGATTLVGSFPSNINIDTCAFVNGVLYAIGERDQTAVFMQVNINTGDVTVLYEIGENKLMAMEAVFSQ